MNISGLIRNLMNDAQISEPKSLELKVGEVVKGMVLQLLSEQEAIVNIGGVQVRARLETPLKQGQVTLLQVQPDSKTGQILLKPLDASGVQIADDSLVEVLKSVGLPDSTANRQMIQTLHRFGVSLSKDNVQAFAKLQAQVPGTVSQEEWVPSAVVAFQKGIPLTTETVSAVRQAINGPAFHETLRQLDMQMSKLLSEHNSVTAASRNAIQTFKEVVALVEEVSGQLASQAASEAEDGASGSASASKGNASLQGGLQASGSEAESFTVRTQPGFSGSEMDSNNRLSGSVPKPSDLAAANSKGMVGKSEVISDGNPTASTQGSNTIPPNTSAPSFLSNQAGSAAEPAPLPASNVPNSNQPTLQTTASGQTQQGTQTVNPPTLGTESPLREEGSVLAQQKPANSNSDAVGSGTKPAASGNQLANDNHLSAQPSDLTPLRSDKRVSSEAQYGSTEHPVTNTVGDEPLLSRLIKAIGMEHENHIFKLPDKSGLNGLLQPNGEILDFPGNPAAGVQQQDPLKTVETLKSALMQLVQADDIPAALKETAQQAVQQITGQQLMLHSDRSSMFSNITMFVPIINANGEQTAAIHIQSRKGPKGEIDAQNCRLVFDLRMKTIGDTMVDVQVVDRIVSLRVLNDESYIQQLLDSFREEIATGLQEVGYQFISLKCGPYPSKIIPPEDAAPSGMKQGSELQSLYGRKPYRGMDIRV